jgi:hypothetical protein
MRTIKLVLFALAAALFLAAPAAAQSNTPAEEQSFDYNPGDEGPKVEQSPVETTYEDAELVNHPVYGTIMLSKSRWKNWVVHAMYLVLINIALIAVILSLSKTEEYNILVAYIMSGAGMTLSFWIFLCGILLFQLHSYTWTYVIPVSLILGGIGYAVLMKIKKYDVSLSELKESFQKMSSAAKEDPRLASVEGVPGDWPEHDFMK